MKTNFRKVVMESFFNAIKSVSLMKTDTGIENKLKLAKIYVTYTYLISFHDIDVLKEYYYTYLSKRQDISSFSTWLIKHRLFDSY